MKPTYCLLLAPALSTLGAGRGGSELSEMRSRMHRFLDEAARTERGG